MRVLFRHIRYLLKRNWPALLVFEIAYRAAAYMCALQIIRQAVNLSLYVSGYSNLTAENFLLFVRHPFTIAAGMLVGFFLLLLATVEIASMMVCLQYSSENRTIFVSDMFLVGIRQTVRLMRRKPLAWILLMGLTVPFLALQFLVWEVSYVKILQYGAQMIYEAIPRPALLVLLGAALLFLSYVCAFSLPYLLLEEREGLESLRRGNVLRRRDRARNLAGGLLIQGLVLGISLLIYVLAMAGAVLTAMREETRGGVISSLLIYSNWVDMAIGLAAGALSTVFGVAFFYAVYRLRRKRLLSGKLGIAPGKIRLPGLRRLGRRRLAAFAMMLVFLAEMGYVWHLAKDARSVFPDLITGIQITAHRGGAKYAPENTLRAIDYSLEQNADYAELDVQETKDGVLVLLHDNNLKRTTGVNRNIWDMYYYELQDLDAGSFFSPDCAGEKIPTLREAVRHCGDGINLILELKYNGHNPDIAEKVLRVLEDFGIEERTIICSMHYQYLREIKEQNPAVTTSYVMSVAYGNMENLQDADCLSVKYTYLSPRFVERAHAAGKTVHAWTVNSSFQAQRMQRCQVDNLITDTPAAARQVLNGEIAGPVNFWELMKYVL